MSIEPAADSPREPTKETIADPASAPGAGPAAAPAADPLAALSRLFVCALIALGDAGRTEEACQLAAAGWSALRKMRPREAERLNGVLHSLTRAKHPRSAASQGES